MTQFEFLLFSLFPIARKACGAATTMGPHKNAVESIRAVLRWAAIFFTNILDHQIEECKELRPSTITSGKWQRNPPVSESVVMCRFVGAGVPFPLLFFLVLHHATLEIMHHHHRFNNFFRPTSCCFPKFHLDGNHRLTYRTRTQSQKIYEMRCPNVGVTAMRT